MVELWRNPSGDVQLTSVPTNKSGTGLSSEDSVVILELRRTVSSLQEEIGNVKETRMTPFRHKRITTHVLDHYTCHTCLIKLHAYSSREDTSPGIKERAMVS